MDCLADLFVETEEQEIFRFSGIDILHRAGNESATEVTYTFSYSNKSPMSTKVIFPGILRKENVPMYHAIFAVGMCVLPWYWMGFGCRDILIEESVYAQSSDVLQFWQYLYSNVLLEYLLGNAGKAESPVLSLAVSGSSAPAPASLECNSTPTNADVLVPLGGGKDSLVTWGLTAEEGRDADLFYVCEGRKEFDQNTRIHDIARAIGKKVILVDHQVDYSDIGQRSKYNLEPSGHPWAALVLFDAVLVSLLYGHLEVRMGFEKSADFGNSIYMKDVEVNHQFDKSSGFLKAASEYVHRYISPSLRVISPLDSMWDLEVAKVFCTSPRLRPFHRLFISCNEAVNVTDWCCACEKCAFVFIILSAFLPPLEVHTIFQGRDLFADKTMTNTFLALIGEGENGAKPLECVGTFFETRAAVEMAVGVIMKNPTKVGDTSHVPDSSVSEYVQLHGQADSVVSPNCSSLRSGKNVRSIDNGVKDEEEIKARRGGLVLPVALREVCGCLGLSTSELPEFANLPLEEKFAAVLNKYIR